MFRTSSDEQLWNVAEFKQAKMQPNISTHRSPLWKLHPQVQEGLTRSPPVPPPASPDRSQPARVPSIQPKPPAQTGGTELAMKAVLTSQDICHPLCTNIQSEYVPVIAVNDIATE